MTAIDQAVSCYNEVEQCQSFSEWLGEEIRQGVTEVGEEELIDAICVNATRNGYDNVEMAELDAQCVLGDLVRTEETKHGYKEYWRFSDAEGNSMEILKNKIMKEEKLNLVEKLKRVPKGMKLYHTVYGECRFESITKDETYPIRLQVNMSSIKSTCVTVAKNGKSIVYGNGECIVFPSKTQRCWNLFHYAKAGEFIAIECFGCSNGCEEDSWTESFIFKVEEDGLVDPKSYKLSGDSKNLIGESKYQNYIPAIIRDATKEEINEIYPKPKFKVGDIVKVAVIEDSILGLVSSINGNAIYLSVIPDGCPICTGTSMTDKADKEEIIEFKERLRSVHNAMVNGCDIIPWRVEKGGVYFIVSEFGKICDTIESGSSLDDRRYDLHKTGITNYFATRELALKSEIYKFYHPRGK